MGVNDNFHRDSKENKVFPDPEFDFASEMRKMRRTHVFHFKDSNGFFHQVDYAKYDLPDEKSDLPTFVLKEYSLFEHTLPADDEWYKWRNNYDHYLSKFFTPIFKNRMPFGDTSSIDKYELVLTVEKFNDITQFINDMGLDLHKDFIFYLIAKIEEVYVHDVEYYDRPEQQKRLRNFPKEVDKLYNVLKWADRKGNRLNDNPPQLERVTFHYKTHSPIKIEDPLLILSITKGTTEDFDGGVQKNWEKQLKGFVNVYDENQLPNQFRYRVCKALHNFFKYVNAFDFGKSNMTEKEVEAIARILDFASVKFYGRKGVEFDINIDLYDIKQNIKNAIKRKELIYYPTQLTAMDVKPDLNLLLKYFDKGFIVAGMQNYDQHDLKIVGGLVDRFDIQVLGKELLHIYDCLKQRRYKIGHQFTTLFNKEIEQNEDYKSWKALLGLIHSPGKLKQVSFQSEDEKSMNFSEDLSLELIRQALSDYYQKNKFEFENDFYETEIKTFSPPGSFQLIPTGALNKPANRFFPVIIKQLYNYLLNELPPKEDEFMPSNKYYTIIAALLMPVFNLGNPLYDEEYIIEKVGYWHNLT